MHRTIKIKPIKSRLSERQTNMNHCRKISGVVPEKWKNGYTNTVPNRNIKQKKLCTATAAERNKWMKQRKRHGKRKSESEKTIAQRDKKKHNEQIASRAKSMPILLCVCRKRYALDAFTFIYIHLHTLLTIERYNPYARKACTALPHRAHSILAISQQKIDCMHYFAHIIFVCYASLFLSSGCIQKMLRVFFFGQKLWWSSLFFLNMFAAAAVADHDDDISAFAMAVAVAAMYNCALFVLPRSFRCACMSKRFYRLKSELYG